MKIYIYISSLDPPRPTWRIKSGCEATMTYGWRSHLAFNDDDRRDAAVVAKSQQQVLNLIVPATTPEEAGDDQAIDPSPQTEKGRVD